MTLSQLSLAQLSLANTRGAGGGINVPALLEQRTMIFDQVDSEYYWGGSSKTLGDATDQGGGSYTVNDGSWWGERATYLFEYELTEDVPPTGQLFSWTNASNHRFEIEVNDTDKYRLYFSQGGQYAYPAWTAIIAGYRAGRHRILIEFANGVVPYLRVNANVEGQSVGGIPGTFSAPTRFGILRNERFNAGPATNTTFHRVWAWSKGFTSAQRRALITYGTYNPVHLLGDSFLNLGAVQEQIALLCTDDYIAFSQDGVGGSSLADQAVRLAANTDVHNDTLVIIDGGLSDNEATALASIQSMVATIGHDRWYYVEPNYATYASVESYCGDHFVPVTAGLQAENDGSPEDLDDVANGLWPRSLRSDATHLNAAGQAIYAGLIHAFIAADGNMPS